MVIHSNKSARRIAAEVLNQFDPKRNYVGPILDRLLRQTSERQRATDLVLGSIRNLIAIDTVISQFSSRPVERISSRLLGFIRIATYELIYRPETPVYSIVNETVENTKAVGGKKQTNFVNAVLRQITRHITARQIQFDKADPRKALVQSSATVCQFDTGFLPDPAAQQDDYLSVCFSLPRWLITDWLSEFGFEQTCQICLASNRRPGIYVRPNILKTTSQQLLEKFRNQQIEAKVVPGQQLARVESPQAVKRLPGFAEGLFTVQDVTAMQAVIMMNPQPNWKILDLCAAPGTKTTQLAEATDDSAKIIATDINVERLKKVEENVARLGVKSVTIIPYEQVEMNAQQSGLFDAVLLDVPCSNTGVLARRIEVRFRLKAQAIKQITRRQIDLLRKAVMMVKSNGIICYSTCSIQRYENHDIIREFLQVTRDFELKCEKLFLPLIGKFDQDGGYVAILRSPLRDMMPELA